MLSFLSGVYVYVIAWALLGQDNGDNLGPDNLTDFAVSKKKNKPCNLLFYSSKKTISVLCAHSSNQVKDLKRRELNKSLSPGQTHSQAVTRLD